MDADGEPALVNQCKAITRAQIADRLATPDPPKQCHEIQKWNRGPLNKGADLLAHLLGGLNYVVEISVQCNAPIESNRQVRAEIRWAHPVDGAIKPHQALIGPAQSQCERISVINSQDDLGVGGEERRDDLRIAGQTHDVKEKATPAQKREHKSGDIFRNARGIMNAAYPQEKLSAVCEERRKGDEEETPPALVQLEPARLPAQDRDREILAGHIDADRYVI
jgi:hypothetical protein